MAEQLNIDAILEDKEEELVPEKEANLGMMARDERRRNSAAHIHSQRRGSVDSSVLQDMVRRASEAVAAGDAPPFAEPGKPTTAP